MSKKSKLKCIARFGSYGVPWNRAIEGGAVVSDEVKIQLSLEARPAAPAPAAATAPAAPATPAQK